MNPSMHRSFVGEQEEGSGYVDSLLAELNYSDRMPASQRFYPLATPSQISFDLSNPYTPSMGPTSFTTPNDPPQDSRLPSPAFHAADTLQGDVDMEKDLEELGAWFAPIPNVPPRLEPQDFKEKEPEEPSLPLSHQETVPAVIQPDTEKMNKLRQAVVHLYETCMSMDSSMTEFPQAQLLRMQDQLPEINEHITSMVHQQTSTDTVVPAQHPQPPDAPDNSKPLFKCRKCLKKRKKVTELDLNGMRRHVNDVHHPEFIYHCSEYGCRYSNPRRHRVEDHIRGKHLRNPYDGETEQHKEPLTSEPVCSICGQQVSSWKAFYSCFIKHCTIGGPSLPSDASSSRRPSLGQSIENTDDGTNDDQSHLSPATEDPRPPQRDGVGNTTQQFWRGSHTDASQFLNNPTAAPNHLPWHQPLPNNQFGAMPAPPLPRARGSGAPGNGRHLTPGAGYRANPRSPIHGRRNRVVRPVQRQRRSPQCDSCGHSFTSCRTCCNRTTTAGRCHVCLDSSRIREDMNTSSRRDASGPTSAPRSTNPDIANQNPFGHPGLAFDSNAQMALGQGPFGWGAQGYYHDQGNPFNNFGQIGTDLVGARWAPPRSYNVRSRMVLSVDEDVLTEQEIDHSSVLDLKAPQGILTIILPLINPGKKWLFTPLKSLSTMALSGLDLVTQTEEAPSATTTSDPASECQCKCRCRTRTELGPGRRMEMSLELTPADPSESTETHETNSRHLRTRVQIVVKLLKLRSAVATSNRNHDAKLILEQAFAPTLGEMVPNRPDHDSEDSEASDTESVFSEDDQSISSSCSDLQALSLADNPSTDDVVDFVDLIKEKGRREDDVTVMFDFDLHSALGKLSKWSGGSSDSICSDLSTSDPGRLLEYLTAYVLYVIMALGRSGEHASGRRLSQ